MIFDRQKIKAVAEKVMATINRRFKGPTMGYANYQSPVPIIPPIISQKTIRKGYPDDRNDEANKRDRIKKKSRKNMERKMIPAVPFESFFANLR